MTLLERTLLNHLQRGRVELNLTGFDLEGFERAMHQELSRRLDAIEYIAFEDSDILSDAQKIEAIKQYIQEGFPPISIEKEGFSRYNGDNP